MELLFYNEEQDALRVYDTELECWDDMKDIYSGSNFKKRYTSISMLISWGWELVGEI